MTIKQAVARVRGIIRETHRWCAASRSAHRERDVQELRKALAKKTPDAAVGGAINLRFLANWHGQHGVCAILDGQEEGWADVDRAFHYLAVHVQILKRKARVSLAASVLANAVVFDDDATAEALASLLLQSRDDPKVFGLWSESPFGAFMLKLWGLYRGQEIDVARPGIPALGVYQRVLDAWHDERALVDAIAGACDYHLEQTLDKSAYPEFLCSSPYYLLPSDVLVISAVRRKLGLATPEVQHPLLDTPVAKVPPLDPRPRMGRDPLFEEVVARAKQDGLL